jgi:hypothetical protein
MRKPSIVGLGVAAALWAGAAAGASPRPPDGPVMLNRLMVGGDSNRDPDWDWTLNTTSSVTVERWDAADGAWSVRVRAHKAPTAASPYSNVARVTVP